MLIVIEGIDGSGKQTQTKRLIQRLGKRGAVRHMTFPNYQSETSALVRMYLAGSFGDDPLSVNAYAASSFYAVDRMGSFLSDWKQDYLAGTTIVCDRYTTSNAVHQASKLTGVERDSFLDWLFEYEYHLLGLPQPDLVLFLDMPPQYGTQLMADRDNKITGEKEKDIHEKDAAYLQACYDTALYVAQKWGWTVIPCVERGGIRPVDDIAQEIEKMVMNLL